MTYRYKLQIGTLSADGILVVIFQRDTHILTSYFRLVILFLCLIHSLSLSHYLCLLSFSLSTYLSTYLSICLFLSVLSRRFRKLDEVFPTSFHRLPGRGKSFSAACLLRLSLLLSVDTLELFINPANFRNGY